MEGLTDDERAAEAEFVRDIEVAPLVVLEIPPREAMYLVGLLQLALRHPQVQAEQHNAVRVAKEIVDSIRAGMPPGVQRSIDGGWDPTHNK